MHRVLSHLFDHSTCLCRDDRNSSNKGKGEGKGKGKGGSWAEAMW
jgi:hypothetical protein